MAGTFQVKITGTQTDERVYKHEDCSGIPARKRDHFKIRYLLPNGQQDIVTGITSEDKDTGTDWQHAENNSNFDTLLEQLMITTGTDKNGNVLIHYWAEMPRLGANSCPIRVTLTALKGGQEAADAAAAATEADRLAAFEEIERDPHATLYVASMNVSINSKTGLINQGAFKLRWNDLEKVPLWNSGVRSKYIAIQKGEVEDNSVALMKEQVWLPPVWDFKTYNSYADLNTGKHQQSPTLTRVPTDPPTFRVNYGNSNAPVGEEKGLKNKYKRFRGSTYAAGMALAIDDIVKVAMKGMRPKSELNFKQVDTNTRFKKEFLSLFNRVPTTTETIDTTTSATTMMSR